MDWSETIRSIERLVAWAGALLVAYRPSAAWAQQPGDSEAAAETSIHGGWLVIAAYIVLWVGLMGYVAWLAYRQRQLDHQLQGLEDRLDDELDQLADTPE